MSLELDSYIETLLDGSNWSAKNFGELVANPLYIFSRRQWVRQPKKDAAREISVRDFPEPRGLWSYDHEGRRHPFRVPDVRDGKEQALVKELQCCLELFARVKGWEVIGSVLNGDFRLLKCTVDSLEDYCAIWSIGEYCDSLVMQLSIDWPICVATHWDISYRDYSVWRIASYKRATFNFVDDTHPAALGIGAVREDFYDSPSHLVPNRALDAPVTEAPEATNHANALLVAAGQQQEPTVRDWSKAIAAGGVLAAVTIVGLVAWWLLCRQTFWADDIAAWLGKIPVVGPKIKELLERASAKARMDHLPVNRSMRALWYALRRGAQVRTPGPRGFTLTPDEIWGGNAFNVRCGKKILSLYRVRGFDDFGLSFVDCVGRDLESNDLLDVDHVEVIGGNQ